MAFTLALFEVGFLFAVICTTLMASVGPILTDWLDLANVVIQALLLSLCCTLSFYYNDLYDLRGVRGLGDFLRRLLRALLLALVLVVALQLLFPTRLSGREFALSVAVVSAFILPLRAFSYSLLNRRILAERVMILGTSPLAEKILQELELNPCLPYKLIRHLPEPAESSNGRGNATTPFLGSSDGFEALMRELKPDRVVVALSERRGCLPIWDLLSTCMNGIVVEDAVEFYERITRKLAIESLSPSFLVFSRDFKKPRLQLASRRAISLAVAAAGVVLTAPLMALIAILIKLDSRGPVFFIQDRAGLGGRSIRLIKFRTMLETPAPENNGSVWHRDDSSRVTRVGRWLRNLRLDELPQFINILRGDMDLVGPRPEMASNVPTMMAEIPYYCLRLQVRPGITGWAQVRHGYAVTRRDVMEKMRYDLYYIKHMSFWFDLRILFDTVKIVFTSRGS